MQNEIYLLVGALIGFIYTLAAAVIVISLSGRRQTKQTTLGDLRSLLSKVQEEIQQAQEQARNEAVWVQVFAEVIGKNMGVDLGKFVEERERVLRLKTLETEKTKLIEN